MRAVSARFLAAIRGSHRAVSQAFIVAPGQTGTEPDGTEVAVISGDVRFDAKAQIRSVVNLEVSGADGFPSRTDDLLTPYGNEVFVRRGLDYGGGAIEWVSLGYHRIDNVEQDEGPDGPIRITAPDRMAGIIDARLTQPDQFLASTTYGVVVNSLVWSVWGWADIEWDDATNLEPIGRALLVEEDRFAFLDSLVTSLGKIWYWDHRGVLVIKDTPDPGESVWTCSSGTGGVLVQLGRALSREGVYNAVVATGEAFDETAPARAFVVDDDPDSPTYWEGQFGRVPRFYSSPFITTDAQAATAAASILRQSTGLPYEVDFTHIPNPALELWDPMTITIGTRVETHVVETMVIPLSPLNAQTGTTRKLSATVIGEG